MESSLNGESLVLPFSKITEVNVNKVGNKALNLIRLIKHNFLVPDGFIIISNVYELLKRENNLNKFLNDKIQQIPIAEEQELNTISKNIRRVIEDANFPDHIIQAIKSCYLNLKHQRVAVRSSAASEDLPSASFAGLYESYLNIKGLEQLIHHIKRCFSSFWTPHAIIYRINNKLAHDDVNFAVIVQEMINPKVSGVMFTSNPITAKSDELLIESNFGLGESVVSGEIHPDQYIIERKKAKKRSQLKIANRRIGTKSKASFPIYNEDQIGINQVENIDQLKVNPSLDDKEVIEIAKLGLAIESNWENEPQDIEWTIDEQNRIYILQTRPITTFKKIISKDNIIWTRGYADDYWNDNTTPLFFDLLGDHLTKVVNIELNSIMGYERMDEQLLLLHKAHVYFNLNVLKNKVEFEIPKFLRNKDLLHYFPQGAGSHGKETMRNLPFRLTKRIIAELRIMFHDPDGAMSKTAKKYEQWTKDVFNPYCDQFDLKLRALINENDPKTLLSLAMELDKIMITHFRLVRYGIPVHNLGMNLMTQYLLNRFLGKDEGMSIYPILISGLEHKLTETNERIHDLVKLVQSSDELRKIILQNESNQVLNILTRNPSTNIQKFKLNFNEFLNNYGERGFTREPYYPRWNESPSLIFDVIKSLVKDTDSTKDEKKSYSKDRRIIVEHLVKSKIKHQKLGMIKWKLFSGILKNSRKYISFRENQRFNLDRWITRHRKLFLEIGRIFTSQGLIDAPEEIFFLQKDEIRKIIKDLLDKDEKEILFREVNDRYKEFKINEDTIPPKFILNNREFDDLSQYKSNSTIFYGTPASQGIVTATIRILRDISEIPDIKSGEIIVVPRTDPGWTPVFSKIGGLITETGGVLSHGAVIAREYGIPAVTNLQNASKLLKIGQLVSLNGFNGEIKIHK